MKKVWKWFWMLNKRLYKKLTFLILLLCIPVCVIGFGYVSKEDSGFVNVVLVQIDEANAISSEVIEDFLNDESLIHFWEVNTLQEAVEAVQTGSADAAWIFPDDMEKQVRVVEREETLFLRLAREMLSAALYPYCAKAHYLNYIRENVSELASLSDEELLRYFEEVPVSEELFAFDNPNMERDALRMQNAGYLTTPLRGLLGILVVLAGLAAVLFYLQDEEKGTFSLIAEKNRIYVAFGSILIATLNVTVVVSISLMLTGLATTFIKELLCIPLYAACCAVFCTLLMLGLRKIGIIGAGIPLIIIIMLAVCPVFFDFRSITVLQLLLPPTYYINVVYEPWYVVYMIGYVLVGAGMIWWMTKRKKFML